MGIVAGAATSVKSTRRNCRGLWSIELHMHVSTAHALRLRAMWAYDEKMRTALVALLLFGCGGSEETTDASLVDASADTKNQPETGPSCVAGGGVCACAGACPSGSMHGASFAQDNTCPQPCDGCGACSQWCCVPALKTDGGGD